MKKLIKACKKNDLHFEIYSHDSGFQLYLFKRSEERKIFEYDAETYKKAIKKAIRFMKISRRQKP